MGRVKTVLPQSKVWRMYILIFICLGSQIFQMNRLLMEVDRLIDKGIIKEKVYAQIGSSTYKPKNYSYTFFMKSDEYDEMVRSADLIISHGGTGSLFKALKEGKRTIGIARLKKYDEAENDHQLQILSFLEHNDYLISITEVDELEGALKQILSHHIKPFKGEGKMVPLIDNYIDSCEKMKRK